MRRSTAAIATRAWINEFIVPLKICPFASRADVKVVTAPNEQAFIEQHVTECQRLCEMANSTTEKHTSFVVLDHDLPLHRFRWLAAMARREAHTCDVWDPRDPDKVVDIWYHPEQTHGIFVKLQAWAFPPLENLHFTTRSPYPAVQLLRNHDLLAVEKMWNCQHLSGPTLTEHIQNGNRTRLPEQSGLHALFQRLRG